MKGGFIIFLCVSFAVTAFDAFANDGRNVFVSSKLSRDRIYIGQHSRLTLSAIYPEDTEILFEMDDTDLPGMTILESGTEGPFEISSGFMRKEWWLEFTVHIPGNYTVPPLTVYYEDSAGRHEFITGKHDLQVVRTVGNIESIKDIRDIKPPLPVRRDFARLNLVLAGTGIIILLIVLIRLLVRRRKARLSNISGPPPPHVIALDALEKLKFDGSSDKDGITSIIMEISKIVRKYIHERFGVPSPEMTTEEVIALAEKKFYLSPENRALISDFLNRCDGIKFTAKEPGTDDYGMIMKLAREFISKTA